MLISRSAIRTLKGEERRLPLRDAKMLMTLDTTFFAQHYFSREEEALSKKGIVPTIVLSEFHALAHKRAGKDIAEKHFKEITESGLSIAELNTELSKQASILRRRYEEQIPWADCIIAATALTNKAELIITKDPHLEQTREIKTKKLNETRIQ